MFSILYVSKERNNDARAQKFKLVVYT